MKNYRVISHLFLLLLFLLTACSSQSSEQKSADTESIADYEMTNLDSSNTKEKELAKTSEVNNDSDITKKAEDDRLVIYNANLSLQVKNYHQVEAMIQSKATELGGYVVESSIYDSGTEYINGMIIVKIPQTHFQSYIKEAEKLSLKVKEKSVTGNDVTEEFVDLESRLKAKEAVEKRLLTLMEQADKTEDLLKISNDLATVQEEKEQILGRMKYLQNNVDYSTVTIQLEEELVKVDAIKDKESLNTWQKAKSQFVHTINGMISFLSGVTVFVIGLSPIIIPIVIVLIIWIIYRKKRKHQE